MTVSYRAPRIIRLADEAITTLIRKHQEEQIVPNVLQSSLKLLPLHTLTEAECHSSLIKKIVLYSSPGSLSYFTLFHLRLVAVFHWGEGERGVCISCHGGGNKFYVTVEEVCVMSEIQKYSEMHEVIKNKDGMETRMIRRGKKVLYLWQLAWLRLWKSCKHINESFWTMSNFD